MYRQGEEIMSKQLLTMYASGVALALMCGAATSCWAQASGADASDRISKYAPGTILSPPSSTALAKDVGKRAHTHLGILVPPAPAKPPGPGGALPQSPPVSGEFFETPASLACVYGVTSTTLGCNPNASLPNSTKGSKAIAIVDAYDNCDIKSDLATFSTQMGLPAPSASNFEVVNMGAPSCSASGTGWDLESSLDTQYAHGLAPKALVILVEAVSNSFSDLLNAESEASSLVAAQGGGEVSNSWGGGEFSGETSDDTYFTTAKVVYFASAGDSSGTEYPCVSPNVVCAGGTGNSRNPTTGDIQGQVVWTSTGGGISAYEARPSWQNVISNIVGSQRGAPDVASDSDSASAVWVYSGTYCGGWCTVYGTSVASPTLAAISNAAGHFYASTLAEHNAIYSTLGAGAGWNAVTEGYCYYYNGYLASQVWDLCTGAGSPNGFSNKVVAQ